MPRWSRLVSIAVFAVTGCVSAEAPISVSAIPSHIFVPGSPVPSATSAPSNLLHVARASSNDLTPEDLGLSGADLASVFPSAEAWFNHTNSNGYGNTGLTYTGSFARLTTTLDIQDFNTGGVNHATPKVKSDGNGQLWNVAKPFSDVINFGMRGCNEQIDVNAQAYAVVYAGIKITIMTPQGSSAEVTPIHDFPAEGARSSSQRLSDCAAEDSVTVGGPFDGGGGGGGGGDTWFICYYNDVYDLLTGNYLYREDLGCVPLYAQ